MMISLQSLLLPVILTIFTSKTARCGKLPPIMELTEAPYLDYVCGFRFPYDFRLGKDGDIRRQPQDLQRNMNNSECDNRPKYEVLSRYSFDIPSGKRPPYPYEVILDPPDNNPVFYEYNVPNDLVWGSTIFRLTLYRNSSPLSHESNTRKPPLGGSPNSFRLHEPLEIPLPQIRDAINGALAARKAYGCAGTSRTWLIPPTVDKHLILLEIFRKHPLDEASARKTKVSNRNTVDLSGGFPKNPNFQTDAVFQHSFGWCKCDNRKEERFFPHMSELGSFPLPIFPKEEIEKFYLGENGRFVLPMHSKDSAITYELISQPSQSYMPLESKELRMNLESINSLQKFNKCSGPMLCWMTFSYRRDTFGRKLYRYDVYVDIYHTARDPTTGSFFQAAPPAASVPRASKEGGKRRRGSSKGKESGHKQPPMPQGHIPNPRPQPAGVAPPMGYQPWEYAPPPGGYAPPPGGYAPPPGGYAPPPGGYAPPPGGYAPPPGGYAPPPPGYAPPPPGYAPPPPGYAPPPGPYYYPAAGYPPY